MTVRVLVADDADGLRSLLVKALEKDGQLQVVGEARNGQEALSLVEELGPDVLLLDLSMPVLDGMAVLKEVAGRLPVVVLSGYGEAEMSEDCLALGARSFLEKGAPLADIRSALVEAVQ